MIKDYRVVDSSCSGGGDEAARVAEFWARQFVANMADAKLVEQVRRREEYAILAPRLANLPEGATILDGGCGRGEWTVCLAQQGYRVTGLDISKPLIDVLKRRFPAVDFRCGDLRSTGLPAASFDLIFSWGAFEHFEVGLGPCMNESHRLLKPGGRLMISVPFANRRVKRSCANAAEPPDGGQRSFYQWRFEREELSAAFQTAGFDDVTTRPIGKQEGIRRMLKHDLGLNLTSGSLIESFLVLAARCVVGAETVAHMLLAEGRKPL